jgi:hypothetical protein
MGYLRVLDVINFAKASGPSCTCYNTTNRKLYTSLTIGCVDSKVDVLFARPRRDQLCKDIKYA